MNINIKTGANITRLLQSTVTISQAYTELVKNSIQNGANQCVIALNKSNTIIVDDGRGFSDIRDDRGMNDFDKYFVYGNSYTANTDETTSLGHMGIGGKLSNDRLSNPDDVWWSIETKNKQGNCYIMTYHPGNDHEFLDDYNPEVKSIDPRSSNIQTDSGSRIIIHNLDPTIKKNGWPYSEIRLELSSFFGTLVYELRKKGTSFSLILDDEPINFSYDLQGINIPSFTTTFEYKDIDDESRSAHVRFKLSMIEDGKEMEDHPLSGINIISFVKICDFWLNNTKLIDTTIDRIIEEKHVDAGNLQITREHVMKHVSKMIGFISCKELSTVLDRTGMPAKDLSHHTLRQDHPITVPFIDHVYFVLCKWAIEFHIRTNSKMTSAIDALSKEISSLVAEQFFDDNLDLDIFTSDDGIVEELVDEQEEGMVDSPQDERLRESVKGAIEKKQEQESLGEENKNLYDIPKNDWTQKLVRKNKKSRYIPYMLMDFGPEGVLDISKLDPFHKFRILINTSNPKFKFLDDRQTPEIMSMYISEILIKEVLIKKEGEYIKTDTDRKISEFYQNYLQKVCNKIIKSII